MFGRGVGDVADFGVLADGVEVFGVESLVFGGFFVEGFFEFGGGVGDGADVFDDCVVVFCEVDGFLGGAVEVLDREVKEEGKGGCGEDEEGEGEDVHCGWGSCLWWLVVVVGG